MMYRFVILDPLPQASTFSVLVLTPMAPYWTSLFVVLPLSAPVLGAQLAE